MADIFTGDLTMADDWGKVVNEQYPNGAQASGQSVQNFIKNNLKSNAAAIDTKTACFHTIDDGDNNQNVLLAFKSSDDKEAWLVKVGSAGEGQSVLDFIEDELVQTYTRLNKSLPQAYDSVLLENKMDTTTIISTDNTVKVRLKFSSTHYEPSGSVLIPSQTGEEGLLVMQRRTKGGNWETRYETTIPSIDLNDTIAFTEIDLTNYLTNGNQEVQIMVTGKTTNLSTTWLKYNVTKTDLGLIFATPWEDAQTTNYMRLSYYINGAVDKTLNIKITGPGGSGERLYSENIGTETFGKDTGAPKPIYIYDSNFHNYKVVTEGVHNVEAWISVNNTNIESEHLHSQILMIPSPTENSYIIINELNTNLTNWTNQELFKYALYNPKGDTMPISFVLGDYNTDDIYLKYEADAAKCAEINTLTNVIEVETEDSIIAKMDITSNGTYLLDPIEFNIANIAGYSPTEGANFIFNPKSRNNDEKNPKYIENAVTSQPINTVWNGFNFTTDGWVKDDNGNKCLRVLAGQTVEIDYNPFDGWGGDKSCTIEMVIASRNISSEVHPIISMSRRIGDTYESYNGLEVWPTKAIYKTIGNSNDVTQDILFREGVMTHIAVNIMHNMYSYSDTNGSRHPINLVRIFVNGVINREFAYTEDTLGDVSSAETPRKIILGNINAGADLDVYSIRIYKSKLSSANVLQDYIASLPTTTEKDMVLVKNDILGDNSVISYDKVKDKYNTLLWKYSENEQKAYENGEITSPPSTRMVGTAEGNHDDTKDSRQYGDLVIRIIKDDGTVDTDRSGTLNDMSAQGQGTSSIGYWKWNQRWVFQKEGEDKDEDGIISKYTSKFTAENPNSKHNGKKAWQPFAGAPFAKKLDAKINWASPMQSHKIGSTGMYNDLWKLIVKSNEMMDLGKGTKGEDGKFEGVEFTGTDNGYADCRVTVGQVPFMVFCQKDKGSKPEFYGLYTMGPSKGDKPTFGYNDDSSQFANFSMIEGCENGTPLVMGRVPWNDTDITTDDKGEVFLYNGQAQYELSMGETGAEYIENSPTIKSFKAWNRFVYLLNPDLHYFEGTLTQLYDDDSLNTEAFYWTTENDKVLNADAYNVYRYDDLKKRWVNAGIEYASFDENGVGTDYEIVNLKTQTDIIPTGTFAKQNQTFINRRAEMFKEGIEQWFDKRDFMFTLMFLKLIAASDNWAKNTYIYNAGFTDKDGELISKWRFFQDDLDTIFSLDNSGYKVKPYYVEEHDKKESDNSNYFNSDTNALYCLAELAWASDLRSMMNEILRAASVLGGSVVGCFDKYYNDIPRYFPQQAYNEIAKLLYEDGYINQKIGNYKSTTNPLAQAVGDQLEAEMEWQRLRSIYMSSYASFGEFSAADRITSTGALNFRSSQVVDANGNTKNAAYRFEFIPHMWLYPSMSVGGSSLLPIDQSDKTGKTKYNLPPRTKAGEKVLFTLDAGDVDGNTQMYIRGINYYNDIGDLGSVATNPAYDFNLAGERLSQFVVTDTNCENGMPFRPPKLGVPSSGMNNIKRFIMTGRVMGNTKIINGDLDLRGLWRLEEVDVTATSATNVLLPQNSNITSLKLPSTIETLNLADQQKLSEIEIMGVQRIKNVKMTNSPQLNTYKIFNLLYDNGANLQSCSIDNINWVDITIDQLKYLVNIYDCSLKGIIYVKSKEIIDFNLKTQLMNKFGNIDARKGEHNDLIIYYDEVPLSTSMGKVIGESYVVENGVYQYTLSITGNLFKEYKWSISANNYATITREGLLTYTDNPDGGMREATITCEIYLKDIDESYVWVPISKKIYFEPRVAQIGDYVYTDGTISASDDLNVNKTVVGMCYYVNPNDSSDRRMVALSDIVSTYWGLSPDIPGLTSDNISDTAITNITNISALSGTNDFQIDISDLLDQTTSDGFKVYPSATALGDIGLVTLPRTMTTEIGEYVEGSKVPSGLYKTLQLIEHRNENVIKSGKYTFNNFTIRIPGRGMTGEYSVNEYNDLVRQLDDLKNKEDKINQCYYYPAASYCYAYEPNLPDLNNKFKKHNWYLPTFGELARIWYCDQAKLFDAAINNEIYTKLSSKVWSSTEFDTRRVWPFELSNNGYIFTTGQSKTAELKVRPVARF